MAKAKAFDWKPSGASWIAEMPDNVSVCASPDYVHPITGAPKRGTSWRAQCSQWDEPTRCQSRFGRDEYVVKHATRQAAMRAAEAIYNDAKAG